MPRKRYTAEQIITKLREAEVELAKGQNIAQVCRKLGIGDQTYYRWRREYGGLSRPGRGPPRCRCPPPKRSPNTPPPPPKTSPNAEKMSSMLEKRWPWKPPAPLKAA